MLGVFFESAELILQENYPGEASSIVRAQLRKKTPPFPPGLGCELLRVP